MVNESDPYFYDHPGGIALALAFTFMAVSDAFNISMEKKRPNRAEDDRNVLNSRQQTEQ